MLQSQAEEEEEEESGGRWMNGKTHDFRNKKICRYAY